MKPKQHRFHYNVFMFYVDIDELDTLTKHLWMLSRNKFNIFSFKDSEHLQLPINNPDKSKNVKQHITDYLAQQGVDSTGARIMLLTNMNVLGYNFNPVSFYYCFDKQGKPLCVVTEINNTFGEMKLFILKNEHLQNVKYTLNTKKYFYVSPFIDHDTNFDFNLCIPNEKLNVRIDDIKDDERFFISTLTGTRKTLTNARLLWYSLRFPFITLKVITLIHWNALVLWLKKIPYHKKSAFPELQRDVLKKVND